MTRIRRFELHRSTDVSGVSGTGVVAEGVVFTDGTCVIRWHGDHKSTVVWPTIEDAVAVHSHGGATRVVWFDWAWWQPLNPNVRVPPATQYHRGDRGTSTEADAGRFERARSEYREPDRPTRAEAEADERYLRGSRE